MEAKNDPSSPESDVQAVEKFGEARDGMVKELPIHSGARWEKWGEGKPALKGAGYLLFFVLRIVDEAILRQT